MRRIVLFLFLFFFIPVLSFAQGITVEKSTFVANAPNIFNKNQSAALNTKTGQTLVVWEKVNGNSHSIQGRVLNDQGNATGGLINIVSGPAAAHPHVVYNPARNEFMVTYDNEINGRRMHTDIFVKRLNAQGRPSGKSVVISSDNISSAMWNFSPRILFNSNSSTYSILWVRESTNAAQANEGNSGLVGTTLNAAGSAAVSVSMIQKTTVEFDWPILLDAQYHPSSNRLMLVFVIVATGTAGTKANYFFGNLDPAFNGITPSNISKINNTPINLSDQFSWGSALALFANKSGFLVYVDNSNIKRRKIDSNGRLSGGSVPAFKAPKTNTKLSYPSLAFSTGASSTQGTLIGVQDVFSSTGTASLWAQRVDSSGVAIGPPIKLDSTGTTDTTRSTIISPLPQPASSQAFRFTVFYTLERFKPPGQTFENSGIVKLNLSVL